MDSGQAELAVVDFRLPDCDGMQWIWQERLRGCRVPIIFLSGFRADARMVSTLRNVLGVSTILKKPVEPMTFVNAVVMELEEADRRLHAWLGNGEAGQPGGCEDTGIEGSPDPELAQSPYATYQQIDEVYEDSEGWVSPVAGPGETVKRVMEDSDAQQETAALVEMLRQEYVEDLPDALNDLERLLETARSHPEATGVLNDALFKAHKLRGSSGSVGLLDVSEAAGIIEDVLCVAQEEGRSPTAADWSAVMAALARARSGFAPVTSAHVPAPERAGEGSSQCTHQSAELWQLQERVQSLLAEFQDADNRMRACIAQLAELNELIEQAASRPAVNKHRAGRATDTDTDNKPLYSGFSLSISS
jgi:HPt (histidine-containing phosphotransfer) domain-containing protein